MSFPMNVAGQTLAAAVSYREAGFSVFPLLTGSKLPATKWKPYQTVRPTVRQLETWFAGTRNNIALVMGAVSDNAVALDFDDRDLARFAFDLEKRRTRCPARREGGAWVHRRGPVGDERTGVQNALSRCPRRNHDEGET